MTNAMGLTPADEKLRELVLHLVSRYGAEKLDWPNVLPKVLFLSDFYAYDKTGEPITGVTYYSGQSGPFPLTLPNVVEDLVTTGLMRSESGRLVAADSAALTLLDPRHLPLVDDVVAVLAGGSEIDASYMSHLERVGAFVPLGEPIPYELVFVSMEPPSEWSRRVGKEVARRHGLLNA